MVQQRSSSSHTGILVSRIGSGAIVGNALVYRVTMIQTPRITTATLDTLEDLIPLFDAYRVFYGQPSDLDAARAFLLERFLLRESVVFMAYQGEAAVGFTQLYPLFSSTSMRRIWLLNDLYVAPEMRGQRVGQALIERSLEHARLSGAARVELATAHTNLSGQKLYERMEFERRDTVFRSYVKAV